MIRERGRPRFSGAEARRDTMGGGARKKTDLQMKKESLSDSTKDQDQRPRKK